MNNIDSYIALDIETTGLVPEVDKIIEIGAIKIENGEMIETFQSLINPKIEITSKIVELTGITDDMIKGSPEVLEVLKDYMTFAGELPILGHNIIFDYSFLKCNYKEMGIAYNREGIDTLRISRQLHGELPSKSLANMCLYYNIINKHAHRALDDARAAHELYSVLKKSFYDDNPRVFQTEALFYKIKKLEPITKKQINYLNDLLKYHKIEHEHSILDLTRSDASRLIDKIILSYGRLM